MSFTRLEVLEEFAAAQAIATQLVFDFQSDILARRSALHVEHQREYERRQKIVGRGEQLRAGSRERSRRRYGRLSGEALERKRAQSRESMKRMRERRATR